ncbi:MAG: sulfotransferase family 2 domain-containing protein [Bacteroidetes bacterium]|nr:sulfotransferase family 2 domain-containing protein [Bacteroidota bacterium]
MSGKRFCFTGYFLRWFFWVKDFLFASRAARDFDKQLNALTPLLFFTPDTINESILSEFSFLYSGVILQTNYFHPRNTDWRIRRLFRYAMVGKGPLKIVTLVSEPVSENVHQFLSGRCSLLQNETLLPAVEEVDKLRDQFLETYNHERRIKWFERMIEPAFKIDVYEIPFPESGFALFSKDNISLLLVKRELLQQNFSDQIAGFFNFSKKRDPGTEAKNHVEPAPGIKMMCDHLTLPFDYLQTICDSRYFRHFYALEKIDEVFRKWYDFSHSTLPENIAKSPAHFDLPLPNIVRHDLNLFRFWYVDIPRTSSSSIKVELGLRYGVAYGKNNLIDKKYAQPQIIANHIPAKIMKKQVGERLWGSMYKFTLTRNPWDRMVSLYMYRKRINSIPAEMTFRDYIRELSGSRGSGFFKYHGFYLSNMDYISGDNNEILVDYAGKYETRNDDLKEISRQIGFPELGNLHIQGGKTGELHYSQFYDDETRKTVGEIYSKDVEFLNYTFEVPD